MAIKQGDFIEIEYTGKLNDESKAVFDTTNAEVAKKEGLFDEKTKYGPMIIVVGEQQVIPGLDNALVGKDIGKHSFEIADIDAFGKKTASKIQLVPAKVFTKEQIRPFPGLQVNIDGQIGTIRTVSGGRVMVDFNHPLSSKDVVYDVEVKRIITDKKEQVTAFFNLMNFPVVNIEADEKLATITVASALPENLTLPLGEDIKRLTNIASIEFKVKESKKEVKKEESKSE
ncbi:peptidylprolyl isomerase [Candidatus Woesearchaeota archaeon]|nr:peptidylprolyl isomerase [Candidatus Woesearchaeota archaeon]